MTGEHGDKGSGLDKFGQAEIEGREMAPGPEDEGDAPAGGPHATPRLVNPEATPGAGTLPSPSTDDEAAAGTG